MNTNIAPYVYRRYVVQHNHLHVFKMEHTSEEHLLQL